jgi:NAD(P)-dependent dehydrogenase (short-subunit alcohol dehydrogenase family)
MDMKKFLIAGGTLGIGASIAAAFAPYGAQVWATGSTASEAEDRDRHRRSSCADQKVPG